MSFPDTVFLKDRVKEISHSNGTGDFSLDGAATGFGSFSSVYSNGDAIFYAITDGTHYEVGSGQFFNDGGSNQSISRFAFSSSYSNSNVPFNPGIKEVFVTYPGEFALFSAGGMNNFTQPDMSGMAFFGSQQTVDYSSNVIFDKNNSRIGIVQPAPLYSVDVGGAPGNSLMRSSGIIVAESGIIFSGVSPTHTSSYSGGIQLEPFMRNELDATTGSNAIFSLSGLVDQRLLLSKQIKGSIFAGPTSGCIGGCSPDYPTFRYLESEDIPSLSHLYTIQFVDSVGNSPYQGDVTFYKESGVLDHDHFFNWDATNNRLGINRTDPAFTLDVDGDASISGKLDVQKATFLHDNLSVSGNVVISGNLDVQGDVTYIDSSTVTIWDKQLELGSMSGTALYGDSQLDDAGVVIKSTATDKKWTWKDSNDSWRTNEGVGVSGILEVSGHTTFGNDLLVTNNATVSGMFNASGNSTFDGNISAQKKLFVTEDSYFVGATTTSGNLNVSGISTFNNDTYFTNNAPVTMSGTLGTSGDAIFGNNLWVINDATISGNLNIKQDVIIDGNTYYDQDVTISGNLDVSGVSIFNKDVYFTNNAPVVISGTLGISGAVDLDSTLNVDGATTLNNTLHVDGGTVLHDNLSVSGNVVISGNLDVQGDVTYIDSSTVTIWDKQLELASMSGTALYTDSEIDNAGIVIKSTSSDKKWTWHDSNDSWRTDESVGASGLLEVSGHATFGNNLLVTNNAIVKGDTYTVGDSTTSGTLNTSGNAIFNSDVYTVGNATTSGTLNTSGNAFFNGDTYTVGNATASGTLNTSGNAFFNSDTYTAGNVTTSGIFNASGVSIFNEDVYFTNNAPVVMSGTLGVSGITSFGTVIHFKDDHIRIGENAGNSYVDVERNVHIGRNAGFYSSGNNSISIGYQAGSYASGIDMTNVGHKAGYRSIDSLRLSNYGTFAGYSSSGCSSSLFGGYSAGYNARNCDYSVFLGSEAGYDAGGPEASGLSNSVVIGREAGKEAQGTRNLIVGQAAGFSASGTDNLYIGVKAGSGVSGVSNLEFTNATTSLLPNHTPTSNKLNINEMIVGDKSTKRLAIGNVDATHLSPNSTLEIVPNGTDVALFVSGVVKVSGEALFESDITASGDIISHSEIVGERLNIRGVSPLNYINGSTFFRQTASDPFAIRINGQGIRPYTPGSAYNGQLGSPYSVVAGNKISACSGLNTGQSFVYSTYAIDELADTHYQRLGISGSRYGNFEITTEAQGSGLVRPIDFTAPINFKKDVFFTSDAPVIISGTLGVSGQTQFRDHVKCSHSISMESLNVSGSSPTNYINGQILFRQTASDPITFRMFGDGIVPYSNGSAYAGTFSNEFSRVTSQKIYVTKTGGDTGQFFLDSVYGRDPDTGLEQYQRFAISGNRFGNFAITTQAEGSGLVRPIDFKAPTNFTEDVFFTSDASVAMSGTLAVSGTTTLHGGLALLETTTPTALADHGKIYTKADNKLYFQDGGGTEHEIAFA
jgi:cytoskeletal protein CcmA (bactofilin family)